MNDHEWKLSVGLSAGQMQARLKHNLCVCGCVYLTCGSASRTDTGIKDRKQTETLSTSVHKNTCTAVCSPSVHCICVLNSRVYFSAVNVHTHTCNTLLSSSYVAEVQPTWHTCWRHQSVMFFCWVTEIGTVVTKATSGQIWLVMTGKDKQPHTCAHTQAYKSSKALAWT